MPLEWYGSIIVFISVGSLAYCHAFVKAYGETKSENSMSRSLDCMRPRTLRPDAWDEYVEARECKENLKDTFSCSEREESPMQSILLWNTARPDLAEQPWHTLMAKRTGQTDER